MKNIKIDKKRIIAFVVIAIVFASGVIGLKVLVPKKLSSTIARNHVISIKIDAVTEDDRRQTFTMDVVNLKKSSKIKSSFYSRNIYIVDGKTVFDAGGKYRYYEDKNSIRNLYDTLGKISLKDPVSEVNREKIYNPELTSNTINVILESLFIDLEATRSERATVEIDDNRLKSVSLYLIGLTGYKDMNIVMSFDEVKEKDEFEVPIFYDELMERVDKKAMMRELRGN